MHPYIFVSKTYYKLKMDTLKNTYLLVEQVTNKRREIDGPKVHGRTNQEIEGVGVPSTMKIMQLSLSHMTWKLNVSIWATRMKEKPLRICRGDLLMRIQMRRSSIRVVSSLKSLQLQGNSLARYQLKEA